MSLTEPRTVVTRDFPIALPFGAITIRRIAQKHGLTYRDIVGPSRSKDVTAARVEISKELSANQYDNFMIARLLHRDKSSIYYYLHHWTPAP